MPIEPVHNVPQAPRVIKGGEGPFPRKKKEKEKDGEDTEKKEKGRIDISV